ncbi:response regulator transcription factor [Paenibacillus protaetiae]|uniref:Response regulator n=1 Tax=Paenibacillus protaetiae TaxID=2509456 RepID=A0A4P6EQN0_9BACL|nr:response regulator [Paenibacillus protaetiae]QAY65280.1 response regulator [Paenibacillus protaetiae]
MRQLLIVDDQSVLVDDLADMLPWEEAGIDVVHKAHSGKEAIELMNEHTIDVVITDIRMPGMTGLELIQEIKRNWKYTKCILLSGYSDFEYTKQALQLRSSDYLLKPASDEELLTAVRRAIVELEREWQDISSLQRAMYSLREQLPKLREYLLLDLLSGKQPLTSPSLAKKLDTYAVPFKEGDPFHVMLLRLDDMEKIYEDGESEALIDYAIANMAEEVFGDRADIWHCKDPHGFVVCLLKARASAEPMDELDQWIERNAFHLQHAVKTYLKAGISILTSKQGIFPADAGPLYHASITNFRQFIGAEKELFVSLAKERTHGTPQVLGELYRQPSVLQLMELGQWDALNEKLETIFREIEEQWRGSQEHVLEVYFSIAASLAALAHKNKKWLFEMLGGDFHAFANERPITSAEQLREWTARTIASYRNSIHIEDQDSRSGIIRKVQEYIHNHLEQASLHSISSHVYLNPSYLSKIYKTETGEGISEYLLRARMEKSAELLARTDEKIYEISVMLGYQKPSYFIQLFKKHFGITPQEYRNKISS